MRNDLSISEQRFIMDNPHMYGSILARLMGRSVKCVERFRRRCGLVPKWSYGGVGIPFLRFEPSMALYKVRYNRRTVASSAILPVAVRFLDHLMWCIERGYMNAPKVAHPLSYVR